ncbi:MAG: toprim domain-containing protein [Devosia sp.]
MPATRTITYLLIESALSLRNALTAEGDVVFLAALSASGVANYEWPERTVEITAATDNDPSARKAAARLAGRCEAAGICCSPMLPPSKRFDWNDIAQVEDVA